MRKLFSLFAGLWLVSSCLAPASSAQAFKPGTEIQVRLLGRLDTGSTQAGEKFSATLAEPISMGKTVWPKGTQVEGQVMESVSSGRLQRPASITLQLTKIGKSAVETEPEQIDGKSHAGRNVGLIGGGAVAGAILGGIAGGGKGAVIGTAVGAGAGTATAAATGKKEIVLPAETLLTFAVAGTPAVAPQAPEQSLRPEPTYRSDANRRPEQDYRPAADARPEPDYRSDDRRPEQDYRSNDRRPEPDYRSDARRREDGDRNEYRVFFSDRQQDMIRAYFRSGDRRRDLPPGLAKRNGDLPPGLERQLRRNGTLPPGLQRRVEPFPSDLDRRLEPLPGRYSRVILSDRALILRGDQIVDIMFIY
jgi:hypothetical protein